MVPDDVATFGHDIVARLQSELVSEFIGAYFVGSIALGGYVPGESDIDIVAVSADHLSEDRKRSVADDVLAATDACPTRGLEFSLYCREVAAAPPETADFEVNVNGGPRMPRTVHLDPRAEPGFWYVIDRAIAYQCGIAIAGPSAQEAFVPASRRVLLDAMAESMRWHRQHERATLYSVLNASRAWRYAAEGVLGSKLEGAAWARRRWREPALIDAAIELRHGRTAQLNERDVDEFLEHVEGSLVQSG